MNIRVLNIMASVFLFKYYQYMKYQMKQNIRMVLPLFAITPLLLHWQCLPRCLQPNLMKQELRMNLFLKKLSFDRLKLQLWLTSCCCCYDGWDNDRSGDRKIPGLKSVKYLNFSLDIQMFLLKKNLLHCKCFDHKNYRDWKLRGPCRENLHYL